MTPAATATLMICYGSSSGRRSGRGSARSRVECACGFSRAPQATQLGMAPPPVIKLVAGGTEAAANVNPQRDRMLTLGPTRVPPATWRFSGPPRPGKRRWNRPLAHVQPLRDNCIYRAWRNEPRATSQHPRICTRAHASQGTPTPVRHLRFRRFWKVAPAIPAPTSFARPPVRGLYLRHRFPKSNYTAVGDQRQLVLPVLLPHQRMLPKF